MRTVLLLAGCCILTTGALATPICINGTLATYEALGTGGCLIGSDVIGSFMNVSGTTGATEINPALVTIDPTGGTTNPGLTITVNETATSGALYETIFTYMLSAAIYTQDATTLSGSSETGNGAVTDIQNFCAGGHFGTDGVDGCTGTPGSLLTLDGIQNTDNSSVSNAVLLSVTDDLTIDSGGTGSASGATVMDQFTAKAAAPEPAAYLLVSLGFITFCVGKFRSVKQNL